MDGTLTRSGGVAYPPGTVRSASSSGRNLNAAWAPDGRTVGVCTEHDVLHLYDVRSWSETAAREFRAEVNEFRWRPDGGRLFVSYGSGSSGGSVRVLDWPSLALLDTLHVHSDRCTSVATHPAAGGGGGSGVGGGATLATAGSDGSVSIWDATGLYCRRTVSRAALPLRALAFSGDGDLLATGGDEGILDVLDVDTGALVKRLFVGHSVAAVAWHPTRRVLVYAADGGAAVRADGPPLPAFVTGELVGGWLAGGGVGEGVASQHTYRPCKRTIREGGVALPDDGPAGRWGGGGGEGGRRRGEASVVV
ncbi:hypothetical protein MMPV_004884 [Pyropia vietnamensis]